MERVSCHTPWTPNFWRFSLCSNSRLRGTSVVPHSLNSKFLKGLAFAQTADYVARVSCHTPWTPGITRGLSFAQSQGYVARVSCHTPWTPGIIRSLSFAQSKGYVARVSCHTPWTPGIIRGLCFAQSQGYVARVSCHTPWTPAQYLTTSPFFPPPLFFVNSLLPLHHSNPFTH